ncbi:hypothetical protein MF271_02220 (plasmid) [Deinococcus sp. KNUC1210]|uniref:hypothetical protein n=1 Tax=Deinococcus sp. KNUC1210 TaxID=2917691 RepID=UPI001EF13B1A|nr:hypothetical protein [Deinococcus sp. KNUC1210]ULH14117.1 hypothetical protein MF271_02220 [Deinococcus sp. KNUC1210]
MNVYLFATVLGLAGFFSMAVLGLSHGHSPGAHPHAHGGHSGPAGHAHSGLHLPHGGRHPGTHSAWLSTLASPRVLLSLLLGFGLSGLLLRGLPLHLPEILNLLLSAVGGVAFERLLILPYWNALMRFQSRPARSLGSAVMSRAEAVTDFDRTGSGLVRLEFDGEIRQLLATLGRSEQAQGIQVRRGDTVRVEAIDEQRSACTVSSVV